MAARRFTVRTGADLGRAIAEVRRARGLTQEDLAASTGIERSHLAKLEAGARSTKVLDQIMRSLRRLGADVVIIFDEDRVGEA